MRGFWHAMLLLNCFSLLILIDAYVAGKVSIWYPLMVIAAGALCVYAAETQGSGFDEWDDTREDDNDSSDR